MFESENPQVYEKVYAGLLQRLAKADLKTAARDLGLTWQDQAESGAMVPLLAKDYLVGAQGVTQNPPQEIPITHRIVLAYYLMHGGRGETSGRFAPYRELPGGQDFARNLAITVEGRLAGFFSNKLEQLRTSAKALGSQEPPPDYQGDFAALFPALPGLPLVLTFYDADEEFPAEAKLFYDLTAPNFLDLECLAVLGLILVLELEKSAKKGEA